MSGVLSGECPVILPHCQVNPRQFALVSGVLSGGSFVHLMITCNMHHPHTLKLACNVHTMTNGIMMLFAKACKYLQGLAMSKIDSTNEIVCLSGRIRWNASKVAMYIWNSNLKPVRGAWAEWSLRPAETSRDMQRVAKT